MSNKNPYLDKKTKIDQSSEISDLENSLNKTKSEIDQERQEEKIKSEEMKIQKRQIEDSTNSTLSSFKDTMELQQNIWWSQSNEKTKELMVSNTAKTNFDQPESQADTPWSTNTTDKKEKWFFGKLIDNMKEHRVLWGLWWWTVATIAYKLFKKNKAEDRKENGENNDQSEGDSENSESTNQQGKIENIDDNPSNGDTEDEETPEEKKDKDEKNKKEEKKQRKEKKKKKSDSKEKTSRRKKWLWRALWILWVWSIWTLIYKNWGWIKEKLWKDLTIKEATLVASWEVSSGLIDESPFKYKFEDWIQYDSEKKTIKSYGRETKINPYKKTLEWLDDVVFKNNKELVHAANIVNCLKLNFNSRCFDNNPFQKSTWWWWDLTVHLANNQCPECISASDTNLWAWIWWATWAIAWGILWAYCWWPMWAAWWAVWGGGIWTAVWNHFDNDSSMWKTVFTIARWVNFEKFIAYLNGQQTEEWKSLWAYEEDKIGTASPIQDVWKKVLQEIKNTYSDNWSDFNRVIDIKQDENDPTRFLIKSYNETVPLIIDGCSVTWDQKIDYSKIKSIKIGKYYESDWWEWLEIDFSHDEKWLAEAIRTANLTNKIRKDFHDKWWVKYPFWVKMYGYHRHLQINDKWFRWRDVVYRKTLWERFPTIFEDLNKQINEKDQEKLHQQAYWNIDIEWCGSKYVRYLHQMRKPRGSQGFWE